MLFWIGSYLLIAVLCYVIMLAVMCKVDNLHAREVERDDEALAVLLVICALTWPVSIIGICWAGSVAFALDVHDGVRNLSVARGQRAVAKGLAGAGTKAKNLVTRKKKEKAQDASDSSTAGSSGADQGPAEDQVRAA